MSIASQVGIRTGGGMPGACLIGCVRKLTSKCPLPSKVQPKTYFKLFFQMPVVTLFILEICEDYSRYSKCTIDTYINKAEGILFLATI